MSDTHTLVEWTESPYRSYDKRSRTVQHRVVVDDYGPAGADARHEVRSDTDPTVPHTWTEVDVVEVRQHGIQKVSRGEVVRE